MNKKGALEAYDQHRQWTELEREHRRLIGKMDESFGNPFGTTGKDTRYNEPKGKHKASEELINETIENTEIYKRVKELILNAQRKQVGYGLDKYPEPLNADTWSMVETIDHIIDESVDKLHYLVMLRVKLERDNTKGLEAVEHKDAKDEVELGCNLSDSSSTETSHADGVDYTMDTEPSNKCTVKVGNTQVDATFINICQYSDVLHPSPMIGGHTGGIVAYPVAVVRIGNVLKQIRLSNIKFGEETK